MKRMWLAIFLALFFVTPAYAQNGGGDVAAPLIDIINQFGAIVTTLILGAMAEASTWLTGWVRTWGWLSGPQKEKVSGLFANLISAVSSLLVAFVAIGVGWLVGLVGDVDLQTLLVLAGATWGGSSAIMHKLHKFGRVAKVKAQSG